MKEGLEKYDKLIAVFLVIIAFILGIGWWFAEEKSEPVYLTKIDKLMFEKGNISPAIVLTLPDKLIARKKTKADNITIDAVVKEVQEEDEVEQSFSLDKLFAEIPNLHILPNKAPTMSLKYIDFDDGLVEESNKEDKLPKISDDGRLPWAEYSNNVETQPNFKKIAIVIAGSGFDPNSTNKIAKIFASEVSISFSPYATKPLENIITAREAGHETYVDMLLSSKDFMKEDTGPLSMTLNLNLEESIERLRKTLTTPAPIGGIIIRDGVVSNDNRAIISGLLDEVKERGLLMIDATSNNIISNIKIAGLARRKADLVIHRDIPKENIEQMLKTAENIAFDKGQVLIVADPKPVIVKALYDWVKTFSPQVSYEEAKTTDITKPFALVPASNLVIEE